MEIGVSVNHVMYGLGGFTAFHAVLGLNILAVYFCTYIEKTLK